MLIKNDFEVAQPVDKVWEFFDDIPQVAACLPGAELTEDLGDDKYARQGRRPDGAGQAAVRRHGRRSPSATTPPSGSSSTPPAPTRRAAARPSMLVTAQLGAGRRAAPRSTVDQDLQLSGAAAQYGRGMISDVTAVLMGEFATNMQQRIERRSSAASPPDQVGAGDRRAASRSACGPCGWR